MKITDKKLLIIHVSVLCVQNICKSCYFTAVNNIMLHNIKNNIINIIQNMTMLYIMCFKLTRKHIVLRACQKLWQMCVMFSTFGDMFCSAHNLHLTYILFVCVAHITNYNMDG